MRKREKLVLDKMNAGDGFGNSLLIFVPRIASHPSFYLSLRTQSTQITNHRCNLTSFMITQLESTLVTFVVIIIIPIKFYHMQPLGYDSYPEGKDVSKDVCGWVTKNAIKYLNRTEQRVW